MIHQTWKTSVLPVNLTKFQISWRKYNPGIEYHYYDDDDCLTVVRDEFPQYLDAYLSFPQAIQRADLFRYLIVYRYGGLYVDIDMECLRPFDRFFQLTGMMLSVETGVTGTRQTELGYRRPWQIANCIFAAEPGHWFMEQVIQETVRMSSTQVVSDIDVENTTGPRMLTRLFYSLPPEERARISVLKPIFWMAPTCYPNWWPMNNNVYARHHFLGTWKRGLRRSTSPRRRYIERSLLPYPWPRNPWHDFKVK
jgi:inositol phosphorylceramide mannosyltransferase catalytic subunit